MAKLETQINQIYLIHPDIKTSSLILYEEAISSSAHLFVLAELRDMLRKSEANSLKKISEIILASFRNNKKLAAETMFETALAQINQNLADLAHEGNKSWVGKFSCLITLKASNNIYIANNGQTACWLKRKSELVEILQPEKRGTHPLKSFQNFSQGKISDQDSLVMITANILNFVSFELFNKIIASSPLDQACLKISKILQDSSEMESFCGFFLQFKKKDLAVLPEPKAELPAAQNIYAPLPEELQNVSDSPKLSVFAKIPKLSLPAFRVRVPQIPIPKLGKFKFEFFRNLSPSGKFFFISFTIFLILFILTLSTTGFQLQGQKTQTQIEFLVTTLEQNLNDVHSSLIYRDEDQAFDFLAQAHSDYDKLKELNPAKAEEFRSKLDQAHNQVNKTSVAQNPQIFAEPARHPIYLAASTQGLLMSGKDSNSVTLFKDAMQDYFLLNSLKSEIVALAFWQPAGVTLAVKDQIYRINENLKQFEPVLLVNEADLVQLRTYNNNLYALDKANGRIIRITSTSSGFGSSSLSSGDYSNVRDFGIDGDVYLLSQDSITKIVKGTPQAFPLPRMSDTLTNATKIVVGSNLYILEPNKKRVVILSKNGTLLNQITFPTVGSLFDLAIDEAGRNMFLLDDNKLLRITF